MTRRPADLAALLLAVLLCSGIQVCAETASGRPVIIDGDTLTVNRKTFRLVGIDAPEIRQTCKDPAGEEYKCGVEAMRKLSDFLGAEDVTCESAQTDAYGRALGVCTAGGVNLNAEMVRSGHALAFVKYDSRYAALEVAAKGSRAGLWAGTFDAPWDWRRKTAAKSQQYVPSADKSGCTIKGNISGSGERIYHLPAQVDYAKVRISKRAGERLFCSEDEAIAAGWRRAAR